MKTNYHTHTYRCNHASGNDEDYVKAAIKAGFNEIGFSDHSPWKYTKNVKSRMRMDLVEFDEYYQSISRLKKKYAKQISIKIGLECEYYKENMDWLCKFIKDKKIDYIIYGNHFSEQTEKVYFGTHTHINQELKNYIDMCIEGLSTNLYSYLAHPDLFMRSYRPFDEYAASESRRLCEYCKENDIALEYNLGSLVYSYGTGEKSTYPYPEFWKIAAEVGNKAIIGIDAHTPESYLREEIFQQAQEHLKQLNMHVVDEIELKW